LVFALFVAALFASSQRLVVKPIDRLANAAAAVATGDRDQAVAVRGPEEIERLQRSFNKMVIDLRSREQDLRAMLEQHEQTNRDLHDDVLQSIYAVGLTLERVQSTLAADAQAAKARLGEAIRYLNGIMSTLRSYIVEPAALSGGAANVFSALSGLIRVAQENKTPKVDAALDPEALPNLSHEQAHHLLNIAREAISNTQRHAQARTMQVGLQQHNGCAQLTIRDDGCGFDAQTQQAQGHGLRNMAQRARLIKADLAIQSAPGAGTRIVLSLPLAGVR
jgi:two-component system, NarL family, sensor histidine kinase UhpB